MGYGVRMSGKANSYFWSGRVALHAVLCAAVVLAGCASKPSSRTGGGAASRADGERPVALSPRPDKDGAPARQDLPGDLRTKPEPQPQVEPIRMGGPNKPYEVAGQSYAPITSDVRWKERGMASWYGTRFHGRKTASGELFSMYGFTAAHRTLPIPSYARVRHVASGKEIVVRVNDRGPFHSARVIDLSYAAALKLGIVNAGAAAVEVERLTFDDIRTGAWKRDADPALSLAGAPAMALEPVSAGLAQATGAEASSGAPLAAPALPESETVRPAPQVPQAAGARAYTEAAKGFWIQLAALTRKDGVDKLHGKVSNDLASLAPMLAVFKEASLFKLQAGPYASRQEAHSVAQEIKRALQLAPMVLERR